MEVKLVSSLYPTPFDTRRQPKLLRGDVHHGPSVSRCAAASWTAPHAHAQGVRLSWVWLVGREGGIVEEFRLHCKMNSLEEKMKVVEGYCEVVTASEREKLPEIERLKQQMESFEEDRGTSAEQFTALL